jgi:hypothetical protein
MTTAAQCHMKTNTRRKRTPRPAPLYYRPTADLVAMARGVCRYYDDKWWFYGDDESGSWWEAVPVTPASTSMCIRNLVGGAEMSWHEAVDAMVGLWRNPETREPPQVWNPGFTPPDEAPAATAPTGGAEQPGPRAPGLTAESG